MNKIGEAITILIIMILTGAFLYAFDKFTSYSKLFKIIVSAAVGGFVLLWILDTLDIVHSGVSAHH